MTSARLAAWSVGVAVAAAATTACGPRWEYRGLVVGAEGAGGARPRVVVVAEGPGDTGMSDAKPLAAARVVCDGCDGEQGVTRHVDEYGTFMIDLGTSKTPPPPITLHVSAPGYEPADVEVTRHGIEGQGALPVVVIVLRRSR